MPQPWFLPYLFTLICSPDPNTTLLAKLRSPSQSSGLAAGGSVSFLILLHCIFVSKDSCVMLRRDQVPGVASSTPPHPLPALSGGGSCGYPFKNPSLGKTLMINQEADPSAAASSSGREGVGGREGGGAAAAPSGVAFRGREESRSRRRPAGRALATRSRGWAGAGRGLGPGRTRLNGQGAAVAARQPGRTGQGTTGSGSAVS